MNQQINNLAAQLQICNAADGHHHLVYDQLDADDQLLYQQLIVQTANIYQTLAAQHLSEQTREDMFLRRGQRTLNFSRWEQQPFVAGEILSNLWQWFSQTDMHTLCVIQWEHPGAVATISQQLARSR